MINLVISYKDWTSFHASHIKEIVEKFFNIVYIEDNPVIHQSNTLLFASLTEDKWYTELHQQGYKVVIDLMWGGTAYELDNSYMLNSTNWFWIHDALFYKFMKYDQYVPDRTYAKLAFMPMGNTRIHRDQLFDKVQHQLDDFIWSYVEREGKRLPDDDKLENKLAHYFNPEWYDNTYFSLVTETTSENGIVLSEKSFKPLAFQHPFLIVGHTNLLSQLHLLGFETFENLFDESYDSKIDLTNRIDKIVDNVNAFSRVQYDQLTNEKIKHNYNLFYDTDLVIDKFMQDVINPLLEVGTSLH